MAWWGTDTLTGVALELWEPRAQPRWAAGRSGNSAVANAEEEQVLQVDPMGNRHPGGNNSHKEQVQKK